MNVDETQTNRELSPGKILLQARLQSGLTQEFVAKELYITLVKVKAIELDDFGKLNADTFARGYIRAYANLVKLDVAEVLAIYEQLVAKRNRDAAATVVVTVRHKSYKGAWSFLAVVSAFFVGIWLISVWFFDNHNGATYTSPLSNVSSLPDNIDNLPLTDSATHYAEVSTVASKVELATDAGKSKFVSSASNIIMQSSSLVSSVGHSEIRIASAQQASLAAQKKISEGESLLSQNGHASQDTKQVTLDEISFVFSAESWLEVSDSRGDVLATELQAVGSKLTLVGKAPFDVKLGNAPAVTITLNGKKFDVIPLLGSNVLTVKIGN